MPRLTQITPFVLTADMDRALRFYREVLGFALGFRDDNYAFIRRDAVALRLLQVEEGMDLSDPARQQHCYIDVEDLDGLHAEMKPMLDTLPEGRVRAPFDTYYGQREFHVIDEDALLISFGQKIAG
ncbi:VOC family protein [Roseobacter sp. HKCCA0434]|uniref:bleomycin resistance protein n=1 Tax=Roseobacter sp. HKCCA0434 TaxID=3079297 RepID=UPI0029058956|nr:VOC family protein [Roseobacter sp. HKCCA0434]